jgi:hypothetical protein
MSHCESWFIHILTLLAASCVTLSIIYWFFGISFIVSLIVIAITLLFGWRTRPQLTTGRTPCAPTDPTHHHPPPTTLILFLLLEASLLYTLYTARTDAAIVSPWDVLPIYVFGLYAAATFVLVFALKASKTHLSVLLVTIHALTTWCVALIVYQIGFGYDPFVHQATERYIFEHGSILPKQPFYICQYVLVTTFAWLTRLDVSVIDKLLVPVLAVLTIPSLLATRLRFWSPGRLAAWTPGLLALFALPLSYLTFTVPFNLSLLFLLWIVLLLPFAGTRRINVAIALMALAATATHPLLGIPTLILALAAINPLQWKTKYLATAVAIAIPLTTLIAMLVYALLNNASPLLPNWTDIRDSLQALFGSPYDMTGAPVGLTVLYTLERWWPLAFIGAGLWGYWKTETLKSRTSALTIASALGLLATAIFLGVFIRIPNIIANEQFEFPLRLLVTIPFLFIPGFAAAICLTTGRTPCAPTGYRTMVIGFLFAALSTSSWFFSYPQHNAISSMFAAGIGRDDVRAVDDIETLANGRPYVALTHQMMAAAALTRFGFNRDVTTPSGSRYLYAIPTGGELYGFYLRLFTDDPASVLRDARSFTNTDLIFVAIPRSWDPDRIEDARLAPLATNINIIGNITVYTF